MLRKTSLILGGTLAFALCLAGQPAGVAADQPVLLSDAKAVPVPAFTLPSDKIPSELQDYTYRTDPTGQLVPNDQNPATPTETTGKTDVHFLTYSLDLKRLDTTQSACDYYNALKTITNVTSCGTNGELMSGGEILTFEKWKHDVALDQDAPPGKTDVAHFINLVDLSLTRNHHMVSYGPNQLAGYVCNHSGPTKTAVDPTGLFPTPREVDRLIKSIRSDTTLIACVAMEYSTRGQPAGTPPFTKFFIFGANDKLLSTVDLDGRGPKGVPNVCTACHGGTFDYNTSKAGEVTAHFDSTVTTYYPDAPTVKRPPGDLGAHFLPFDKANFAFSTKLTQAEQDEVIFKLNLDVYNTEISRVKLAPDHSIMNGGLASASITDVISGWYNGNMVANNPAPGFNTTTVPSIWDYYGYNEIYLKSYAHNCRTCHVAMERVPLERDLTSISGASSIGASVVCTSHLMPNAKITFDRFWLSDPFWTFPQVSVPGQPSSTPNQPELLNEILACPTFGSP